MLRAPEQIEAEAKANRRKLLAAEAAALLLLRRRRTEILSAAAGLSPGLAAARLRSGMDPAIVQARQLSRIAGLSRLRAEAAALGFDLASVADAAARDVLRARRAAQSFAERWFALRRSSPTEARATRMSSPWLERIGVTESSEAFSSGRTAASRSLSLLRVWDAVLDRGTCPVCAAADGTIVGVRERFPRGEPGAVHPYCRCSWTLLTAEEAAGVVAIRPAAPAA